MLSRNKTDGNNMSELRMMKKQKLLILLMTTNESADHNNLFYTFQELSLFLIKYSFILYDNTIDRKFFKRVFYPHGEIFFQNSNGARYLDPKYSRWLSVDPALGEYASGSDAGCGGIYNHVNLSLYHYGGNNPVKYIDPDGRKDIAKTAKAAIDVASSLFYDSLSSENGDRSYISCFTQGFTTTDQQTDKISEAVGTVDTVTGGAATFILSPIKYHFDKSGNNYTVPDAGSADYLVTAQNEIRNLDVLIDCYKDDVLFSDFLMDQKSLLLYEIGANKKNLYQHFYPLDPFVRHKDCLSFENISLSEWENMFPERIPTLTDGGKLLSHKSVNYIDAYRQYCNEYNRPEKFKDFWEKWGVQYE